MKLLIVLALGLALAECFSKPCVDGQRTSSGIFGVGSSRVADDPCPEKC